MADASPKITISSVTEFLIHSFFEKSLFFTCMFAVYVRTYGTEQKIGCLFVFNILLIMRGSKLTLIIIFSISILKIDFRYFSKVINTCAKSMLSNF